MGSGVPDADLCDNQCRIKLQSSQVYIINYVDQWSYCNPIPHTGCIGLGYEREILKYLGCATLT